MITHQPTFPGKSGSFVDPTKEKSSIIFMIKASNHTIYTCLRNSLALHSRSPCQSPKGPSYSLHRGLCIYLWIQERCINWYLIVLTKIVDYLLPSCSLGKKKNILFCIYWIYGSPVITFSVCWDIRGDGSTLFIFPLLYQQGQKVH